MIIERAMEIAPALITAVYLVTSSISVAYGQGITGFAVSAKNANPQNSYKVCGGLMGETDANLGCQSLEGTVLQQNAWQFRFLDIDLDYQKTRLYGCIIDDTTNMSFCDSMPIPAAGGSSLLSIDLNKPSKMPSPAHLDEGGEDSVDSGDSENNDEENEEEEENE